LVRLHGGRVWVESAPGAGAAFRVALPSLQPAPPERDGGVAAASAGEDGTP
jgi:hypothetical protein